ncbi:Beta-catenin-interacting protein 1 [Turdus rufiventris]|nr:Beta-catenin-interacting protein 1 [Turdus rufiventris]
MNREGVPGKSPEEMYIQQKVRVLLMLRKMGSNRAEASPLCPQLTASEEEFLRTYAGVVNSQLSQLPQHSIDQDQRQKTEDSNYRTSERDRTGEDSEIPEDTGGWLSINKSLCPP